MLASPAFKRLLWLPLCCLFSACSGPHTVDTSPELPQSGSVISPRDLARQLRETPPCILDARPASDFALAHIPNATSLPADQWESLLNSVATWTDLRVASALEDKGISSDASVVLYGDNLAQTARLWWTLRYLGVEHASILDGGWTAWRQGQYAASTSAPTVKAGTFELTPQANLRIKLPELLHRLDDPALYVVDTRSRREHSGELILGSRAGRIPGSLHLDWKALLDDSGRFKTNDFLQTWAAQHGIPPEAEIVVYCYSGARSSVAVCALQRSGFTRVRNYYEGWREWSATTDAPIEFGLPGDQHSDGQPADD